jgi:hypothetical protein
MTTDPKEPTQEELDAQARARQDVSQHPRMLAMAEIAKKHEDAIEDQLAAEGLSSRATSGEQPVNDTRTTPPVEQTTTTPPVEQQTQQATTPPAQAPAKTVDPQLLKQFGADPVPMETLDNLQVRVKIDGQDRVMSLHDLRRSAQLDGAAHARLEQANKLLKDAQEAVAKAGTKPPVGVETKPGSGDSSATSKDVTAVAKDLVQALFVGDEEAAVATVTKLLAGAQPSAPLDPSAIARQVAPAVRQQLSQEEAEKQFRSDYKDVIGDPILVTVADRMFEEVMAEEPQKSYAEALIESGNRTRQWLESRTGRPATEPPTASTRQEKLAAKARIDNVRALGRTDTKQEPAIETPSQVIQKMREARGLA